MERTLIQTLCIYGKNFLFWCSMAGYVCGLLYLDEYLEKRYEKRQILKNKRKRTRGKSLKR